MVSNGSEIFWSAFMSYTKFCVHVQNCHVFFFLWNIQQAPVHPQRHWFTHIKFDWWGNGGQIALSVLMDGIIWLLCWSCVPKSWPYLLSLPLICLSLFHCHSLNLKIVRAYIATHQLELLQFISIWGALGVTIHWDLHSFPPDMLLISVKYALFLTCDPHCTFSFSVGVLKKVILYIIYYYI